MATNLTTTTRTLFECFACKKPVIAHISWEVGELVQHPGDRGIAEASLTARGMNVDHNCIPSNTRGSDATTRPMKR